MLTVLLAPDSFKESLPAEKVCTALRRGISRVWPHAEYFSRPMADGGEGTVTAVINGGEYQAFPVSARNAHERPIKALIAWDQATHTAVIELAQASGLERIPIAERNIWMATSHGVGDMIKGALNIGARHIILGVGGSACNDGGSGMLEALGVQFLHAGTAIPVHGPQTLSHIDEIDTSALDSRLLRVDFVLACDVDNPLVGPRGASEIFAPQKGATIDEVPQLDATLNHFADICATACGHDSRNAPGAGAAGGTGYAALQFLKATCQPGVQVVSHVVKLPEAISQADLVITGEGRVDRQTSAGKTPWGVAELALAQHKPVIVVAGSLGPGYEELIQKGVQAVVPILRSVTPLTEALNHAEENLAAAAETIARLMQTGKSIFSTNQLSTTFPN